MAHAEAQRRRETETGLGWRFAGHDTIVGRRRTMHPTFNEKPKSLVALLALCTLAFLPFSSFADETEQPEPAGYLIEVHADDEVPETATPAALDDTEEEDNEPGNPLLGVSVVRNGKPIVPHDGLPIYQGDIIETAASTTVAVALQDLSAITIYEESKAIIQDYAFPSLKQPTWLRLEEGAAHFDVKPRPADARFNVATRGGNIQVKGTKFVLTTNWDPTANNGQGAGITDVMVKKGTVTATDIGGNAYDFRDAELEPARADPKIYTLQMYAGDPAPNITTNKKTKMGNRHLKKLFKAGAVSVVSTKKNKRGKLAIVALVHLPDGRDRKTIHREKPNGRFNTKIITKGDDEKKKEKYRGWSNEKTGIDKFRVKVKVKNEEEKTRLREKRIEGADGSVSGKYFFRVKGRGTKERLVQKGIIGVDENGIETITIREKGRTEVGTHVDNQVVIKREYLNGQLVETITRTSNFEGGDLGGLPSITKVIHNPDGTTTEMHWYGNNANINNPPDNVEAKGTPLMPVDVTTPKGTIVDLMDRGPASP